jgi:hypothetical protein
VQHARHWGVTPGSGLKTLLPSSDLAPIARPKRNDWQYRGYTAGDCRRG